MAGTVMLLSGCVMRGHSLPYRDDLLRAPDPMSADQVVYDLPLGPLDVVNVRIFRIGDLSGDYQVDSRGMIAMPLIGALDVRDMRPADFAEELRRRYGARYLTNPDVSVRIVTTNSSVITVEGGVMQSGMFPLTSRTTLLGAVALAKGLNEDAANPRRAAIFRRQGGQTVGAAFDLIAIRQGKSPDPVVYPGDTVIVESNDLRKVYRDLVQSLPAFTIFRAL